MSAPPNPIFRAFPFRKSRPLPNRGRRITMTAKDRFAPEEWNALIKAPMLVGFAAVGASPTGSLGFVREMVTIADALVETGQGVLPDSIVGSVVAEIKANPKRL